MLRLLSPSTTCPQGVRCKSTGTTSHYLPRPLHVIHLWTPTSTTPRSLMIHWLAMIAQCKCTIPVVTEKLLGSCSWKFECELAIAAITDQRAVLQYSPLMIHQHQLFLPSILMNEQLVLWGPGSDQCLFAEFNSINGLGNWQTQLAYLSYHKKRRLLVLLQFLSSGHSQKDSDNILLGYFTRESHCVFRLCLIHSPDDFPYITIADTFISTRSTELLDGEMAHAAQLKHILKLKLGGINPGDMQINSESFMFKKGILGFILLKFSLLTVLFSYQLDTTSLFNGGLYITLWSPLAGGMHVNMEILSETKRLLSVRGSW
ncbi:unnamed protein product [Urochloa humidicola]